MTLIERIKKHYETNNYPPMDEDVDAELVDETDDGNLRWGTQFTNVYRAGNEYIAVSDVRPATEEQSWGDYGEPDIFPVTPVTKTIVVTTYEKVNDES